MQNRAVFTDEQRQAFETVGYVHLPAAVPADAVAAMRESAWDLLARQGITRDDPATWRVSWTAQSGAGYVQKMKGMSSGGHAPERSREIVAALDAVFPPGERDHKSDWGQPLLTRPVDAPQWLVPRNIWHFDHSYNESGVIEGVNVFLLVDDIEPRGGGTVVVRNSPVLMDRLVGSGVRFAKLGDQNKRFLRINSWTRGLKVRVEDWSVDRNETYLRETVVDGVPLRVDELCGSAGDVYFCHPALAHAPSMNVSDRIRFMRAQRFHWRPAAG